VPNAPLRIEVEILVTALSAVQRHMPEDPNPVTLFYKAHTLLGL